jgi:hypothetical protein
MVTKGHILTVCASANAAASSDGAKETARSRSVGCTINRNQCSAPKLGHMAMRFPQLKCQTGRLRHSSRKWEPQHCSLGDKQAVETERTMEAIQAADVSAFACQERHEPVQAKQSTTTTRQQETTMDEKTKNREHILDRGASRA